MNRTSNGRTAASARRAHSPIPTAPSRRAPWGVRYTRHESAAPIRPAANQRSRHMGHLLFLGGKRPVLERQAVAAAAALDRVPRLRVFGEGQQFFAVRTAHLIGEGRDPAAGILPDPKSVARAVRALHQVSGPHAGREFDRCTTVGALDDCCRHIPSSRWRRPRSKPPTTSSSTVMTGTAIRPVLAVSSLRATASSATFLAVKAIPGDERNSVAAWHGCRVVDQYTVTARFSMVSLRSEVHR